MLSAVLLFAQGKKQQGAVSRFDIMYKIHES